MNNIKKEHAPTICCENWHSFEIKDVMAQLKTGNHGLTDKEVKDRQLYYGPNSLPTKKPPTIFRIIFNQLMNPLVLVLIAAAIASIAIGDASDALFILIVITINSSLGTYQEHKAEKSASSLLKMMKITARVRRDRMEMDIPAEELVPGDIVILETGLKVPADIRLITINKLSADESFLTGESMAANKKIDLLPRETVIAERKNMAFAGSTIVSGKGEGIVVATGAGTQVGIIAKSVAESKSAKTPLIQRMEKFTKNITVIVAAISFILAIILRLEGYDLTHIFFFVVALAVSAIPEGLPIAVTVALSIATKRMARRNVIVRRLNAVEALGSCTVIASDKTGTLTVNQQTARQIVLPDGSSFNVTGEGYNGIGEIHPVGPYSLENSLLDLRILAETAILANDGHLVKENGEWKHRGDSMDVAFLALGYKLDVTPKEKQKYKMLRDIPYESEKKYSAAILSEGEKIVISAKGAVETILGFCTNMQSGDEILPVDKKLIEMQAEDLAQKGLRVLALARKESSEKVDINDDLDHHTKGLTFVGIVGFIDPLRPEAIASVKECKEAGIRVLMITGDHQSTAKAIAKDLKLSDKEEEVVTGAMLSASGAPDSPAYEELVMSTHVFARVSPTQKLEIVNVLIRKGEFVAVTGDGVNDTPALKTANIGVAMGSGTDAAKEVGSMIIADDKFSSIVAGVEEGRFAYDNIRKVIYLLISTGIAGIIFIIPSVLMGLPLPLLPVQLLWLNLVTNGIQDVALAFEGGEKGAMRRKPRNTKEGIFDHQMIKQTVVSSLTIAIVVFVTWYWLIAVKQMPEYSARNMILLLMVLFQNMHIFNCRSEVSSAFRVPLSNNYLLIFGIILAQGIHIVSMHIPLMQKTLKLEHVSMSSWATMLSLSMLILVVMEIFKLVQRKES